MNIVLLIVLLAVCILAYGQGYCQGRLDERYKDDPDYRRSRRFSRGRDSS